MKYVFDTMKVLKQDLSLSQFFLALSIKCGGIIEKDIKELKQKQVLISDMDGELYITPGWSDKIDNILLDSDKSIPTSSGIEHLAERLMNLFPKGRKEGTSHYWKGNKKEIILKLRKFFKLYGNKYTYDKIIEATERYVNSFNGNYRYMRVLKYFIYKSEKKVDENGIGYIEDVSQLAEYLENNDDTENVNSTEWNNELIN